MLYLSRLILNLRDRSVQAMLSDCHTMHSGLMTAFPAAPDPTRARDHFGVLYRVEQPEGTPTVRLLVQSQQLPDWSIFPARMLGPGPDQRGNPAVRSILDEIGQVQPGMQLRFRLRANPTKRVSKNNSEQDSKWHGKRIELRREPEQLNWLERKAQQSGFRLLQAQIGEDTITDVQIGQAAKQRGRDLHSGHRMRFGVALFEGRLEVSDSSQFLAALQQGIGSGKAYGFGLLSIASLPGA